MRMKKDYEAPSMKVSLLACTSFCGTSGLVGAGQSTNGSLSGSSSERERNNASWGDVWNEGKDNN